MLTARSGILFVEFIMGPGIQKIDPWGLITTGAPNYTLSSCLDSAGFQTQLSLHLQPILNNLHLVHSYSETVKENYYLPSTDVFGNIQHKFWCAIQMNDFFCHP